MLPLDKGGGGGVAPIWEEVGLPLIKVGGGGWSTTSSCPYLGGSGVEGGHQQK